MIVKIKAGGSGDITTKILEDVQDVVIRSQLTQRPLSIEDSFLTSLISEVIRLRKETCQISEFDPYTSWSSKCELHRALEENDKPCESHPTVEPLEPRIKVVTKKVRKLSKTGKLFSRIYPGSRLPNPRFWIISFLVVVNIVMFSYAVCLIR